MCARTAWGAAYQELNDVQVGPRAYTHAMLGMNRWSTREAFWKSMSSTSHALFIAGVFCLFLTAGLLTDISRLGANGPLRLVAISCLSGGIAVAYVLVVRLRAYWIAVLVAAHILLATQFEPLFDRVFGPLGLPLTGDALGARMV